MAKWVFAANARNEDELSYRKILTHDKMPLVHPDSARIQAANGIAARRHVRLSHQPPKWRRPYSLLERSDLGGDWRDWIVVQTLFTEASALITGKLPGKTIKSD